MMDEKGNHKQHVFTTIWMYGCALPYINLIIFMFYISSNFNNHFLASLLLNISGTEFIIM